MEKARLTREQADHIEEAKSRFELEEILEHRVRDSFCQEWFGYIAELRVDTIARALYVGYEIIEEDQEVVITEKKRQEFRELQKTPIGEADYHDGVVDTLNFFGITIKGINA